MILLRARSVHFMAALNQTSQSSLNSAFVFLNDNKSDLVVSLLHRASLKSFHLARNDVGIAMHGMTWHGIVWDRMGWYGMGWYGMGWVSMG